MKLKDLEGLSAPERRRFLKLMGLALAAPAVPLALRHASLDLVGEAAAAELPVETFFIEIDLRDQWDHGHFFVAPGLATAQGLKRGETGRRAAVFYKPEELQKLPNDIYLTPESASLAPHVDNIAMIETCELSKGQIHGHEAANALRSPGRDYEQRAGTLPMFRNDPSANFPQGCEAFYSAVPTPATLHNYAMRRAFGEDGVHNGIAFKGVSRSIHTVYHFAAGLPGAELDRYHSQDSLLRAFATASSGQAIIPSKKEAEVFAKVLEKIDRRFLAKRGTTAQAIDGHATNVAAAHGILSSVATRTVNLPLTEEERAYWGAGVPNQEADPSLVKAQIWEQAAYAFKLVSSGVVRSVALEFDYVDVHDMRTVDQMRTMTLQASLTLSRLIQKLKDAGLFDRTLIAIYTADGGRAPAAGSSGNEGKNAIILAGGKIRGGYFGDVRVAGDDGDGHKYSYHAPDPVSGVAGPGYTNNDGRLSGAYVWRTVAKAAGIPDALATQFADVRHTDPMPFVLRT